MLSSIPPSRSTSDALGFTSSSFLSTTSTAAVVVVVPSAAVRFPSVPVLVTLISCTSPKILLIHPRTGLSIRRRTVPSELKVSSQACTTSPVLMDMTSDEPISMSSLARAPLGPMTLYSLSIVIDWSCVFDSSTSRSPSYGPSLTASTPSTNLGNQTKRSLMLMSSSLNSDDCWDEK